MNKTELVETIALTRRISKRNIDNVVTDVFNNIGAAITQGSTVKIRNFGTFKSVDRQPRTGINPRTKEPIQIPATTAIKFVPAKELVEELNG